MFTPMKGGKYNDFSSPYKSFLFNFKLPVYIDKSCLNFNNVSCLDGHDPQTTVCYLRTK